MSHDKIQLNRKISSYQLLSVKIENGRIVTVPKVYVLKSPNRLVLEY